jgi:PhzF family phenazine biosynthesis protein
MIIYQVDAFAEKIFSGNPAGVCILPTEMSEAWMQNVAMEMNLAETAFLRRTDDGAFHLRWFTPEKEVDLCGHATLASAHILWQSGELSVEQEARFYTRSGILTARQHQDWIVMDFPNEADEQVENVPAEIENALGTKLLYVGKNRMDYIVEVGSDEILRNLQPNQNLLARIPSRGVIVTSKDTSNTYDFISRYFAPSYGIPEDPVTGSAHCCLGPYWQRKLNKATFTAYQASRRGGVVKVEIKGDRVLLRGKAVTAFEAELLL